MKAEEIKTKKLSVKKYLSMIIPYLSDLINDQKAIRNESNEWKIQLNMSVNFISSNDTGEIRTFLCGVIMKKFGRVMKQMTLLVDFLIDLLISIIWKVQIFRAE